MKKTIFLLIITLISCTNNHEIQTPLQKSNYTKITSYDELKSFVEQLDQESELLSLEVMGQSVQNRNLYALKFSTSEFGNDSTKIKVLLFVQQHGNEQSGKEGALMLATELLKRENHYLFDKIDLVIVPQVNPDGSEVNQRRNGNEADLNRNHLILTEPETMALHRLFDKYLFQVSMDVHEYSAYGETWKNYGYRDNSDILLGSNTNPNVSGEIRELSNKSCLPFMKEYLNEQNIPNFLYTPGGPPEIKYMRQSTFDINDGRQSLGIQNTFSFIQEGMNGTDGFIENIKHRAEAQMTGMRGLLEYTYLNKEIIKNRVARDRESLINESPGKNIAIQMEHVSTGEILELPVYSYSTGTDSIINVIDYRGAVQSIFDVKKPVGYLIPKKLTEVVDWLDRQAVDYSNYQADVSHIIEQYKITAIDSIDFEGDTIVDPSLVVRKNNLNISPEDYIFVPTAQLKGNMIVTALEPKSMLGIVTYKIYAHLLKKGETFPILRVVTN